MNGQIKLFLSGTIVKDFDDEELNRILLVACKAYVNQNVKTIETIKTDPLMETFLTLKYIHVKVKLFEKYILAHNFSNHDMRLVFGDNRIDVPLEGFVYAKEFSQVNKSIANNPQIIQGHEIINQVLTFGQILPTTTLDWRTLANNYKLEEIRAKHIVE